MVPGSVRWYGSMAAGLVVALLGALWTMRPAPFFDKFCITPPCGIGLAFGIITVIIGVSLVTTGFVLYRRDHARSTITVAIRGEAEHDVQALGVIEESIAKHQNPEKHFMDEREKSHKHEEFIDLGKDELQVTGVAAHKKPVHRHR